MSNQVFNKVDENGKPIKESAESNKQYKRRLRAFEENKPQNNGSTGKANVSTNGNGDVERTLTAKQKLAELELAEANASTESDETPKPDSEVKTLVAENAPASEESKPIVNEATTPIVEPVSDEKSATETANEVSPDTIKPDEKIVSDETPSGDPLPTGDAKELTPVADAAPTVDPVVPTVENTPAIDPVVETKPEATPIAESEAESMPLLAEVSASTNSAESEKTPIAEVKTDTEVKTPPKPDASKLAEAIANVVPDAPKPNPTVASADDNKVIAKSESSIAEANASVNGDQSEASKPVEKIDLSKDSDEFQKFVLKMYNEALDTGWLAGKSTQQTSLSFSLDGKTLENILLGNQEGKHSMAKDLKTATDIDSHIARLAIITEYCMKWVEPKGDSAIAINAIKIVSESSDEMRDLFYARLSQIQTGSKFVKTANKPTPDFSKLAKFNSVSPKMRELLELQARIDREIYELMLTESEESTVASVASSEDTKVLTLAEKREAARIAAQGAIAEASAESEGEAETPPTTETTTVESALAEHRANSADSGL